MADPLDRLPPATRRRLDAFSGRADRIAIDALAAFAARPDEAHEVAVAAADQAAAEIGLARTVAEARRIAWDYIDRRFAVASYQPAIGMVPGPFLTRGPERAQLATSFGDAVIAIILGDGLSDADRDELFGAWAQLLD